MLPTTSKHRTDNKRGIFLLFWATRCQKWWNQKLRVSPQVLIPDRLGKERRQMEDSWTYLYFKQQCKRKESLGSKRQRVEEQSQPGRFPEEGKKEGDLIPQERESEQGLLDLGP
jgi:hypothetical protein